MSNMSFKEEFEQIIIECNELAETADNYREIFIEKMIDLCCRHEDRKVYVPVRIYDDAKPVTVVNDANIYDISADYEPLTHDSKGEIFYMIMTKPVEASDFYDGYVDIDIIDVFDEAINEGAEGIHVCPFTSDLSCDVLYETIKTIKHKVDVHDKYLKYKDAKYVDIFFNAGDAGCYKIIQEERTYSLYFGCELNVGNILDARDYNSRINVYKQETFTVTDENCLDYNDPIIPSFYEENGLELLKNENRPIRIWAGKRDSVALCGLYFLCHELMDKDLLLVDIPVVESTKLPSRDLTYYLCGNTKGEMKALLGASEEEMNYYLNFDKNLRVNRLTEEEKIKYSDIWERLVEENADLRVYLNGEIVSRNFSDFYEQIKSTFKGKTISVSNLIGDYFHNQNGDAVLDLTQLEKVVPAMIMDNELEVVGEHKIHPGVEAVTKKVRVKNTKEVH